MDGLARALLMDALPGSPALPGWGLARRALPAAATRPQPPHHPQSSPTTPQGPCREAPVAEGLKQLHGQGPAAAAHGPHCVIIDPSVMLSVRVK